MERIGYLDGLRGLAAFTVYLGHILPFLVRFGFLISLSYVLRSFSVCIFFVLSGFVLTFAFFSSGNSETLVSGAVRRYIRLFFPILAVLIMVYVLILPGLSNLTDAQLFSAMLSQAFWGVFLQNQVAYVPEVGQHTGVLWTMSIEFIGSFLVFSFAALFGKLRNRWVFYVFCLILFLNSFFIAFFLGMILADLYANRSRFPIVEKKPVIPAMVGIGSFILCLYPYDFLGGNMYSGVKVLVDSVLATGPFSQTHLITVGGPLAAESFVQIIAAAGMLFFILNCERLKTLMSCKPCLFLGKISFSLYLVHMLVIFFVASRMMAILDLNPINPVSGLIILFITTPVVIASSWLLWRFVDNPGIRISKEIYTRWFAKGTD